MLTVVYAADIAYLPYCVLSARSISAGGSRDHVSFVLVTPEQDRSALLLQQCVDLKFTVVEPKLPWQLGTTSAAEVAHVSQAMYLRLQIAELLPTDVDRFLYLDCDVLCINPDRLAELGELDLGDAAVAAAIDQYTPTAAARGGLPGWRDHPELIDSSPHFNSGVLLVDRRRWLAAGVRGQVETYLRRYSDQLRFPDQDGLNFALAGRFAELSPDFNYVLDRDEETRLRRGTSVCLVHSTGPLKHWSPDYPDGLVKDLTGTHMANLRASGAWRD